MSIHQTAMRHCKKPEFWFNVLECQEQVQQKTSANSLQRGIRQQKKTIKRRDSFGIRAISPETSVTLP